MSEKHDHKNVYRACVFGNHHEVTNAIMSTLEKLKDNAYHGFDQMRTVWYMAKLDGYLVMRHDTFLTPDDYQRIVTRTFHEIATGGTYYLHPKFSEFERELKSRIRP